MNRVTLAKNLAARRLHTVARDHGSRAFGGTFGFPSFRDGGRAATLSSTSADAPLLSPLASLRRHSTLARPSLTHSSAGFFSKPPNATGKTRYMSSANENDSVLNTPRDQMAFDVLIVGGGPAGLAAAIRLKQLCQKQDQDLSVCIIDKGSEIGAHVLSGNVFDPKALHELFPDEFSDAGNDNGNGNTSNWDDVMLSELPSAAQAMPTKVTNDEFKILMSQTSEFTVPNFLMPSQLHNTDTNYIISLSQVCRWLAQRAEDLGVEIYAGFAASEVLYHHSDSNDDGNGDGKSSTKPTGVRGIATRDVGIGKDGKPKSTFERGVELVARQTVFAEGARGSCSEDVMKQLNLRASGGNDDDAHANSHPQTYGLGIKEVWQVDPDSPHFQPGLVQHTVGFPLQSSIMDKTFGGSFIYHQKPNLVLTGLVIGLDYENPRINPYKEFQLLKTHDSIRPLLEEETSECISYGARVLNEGGYHAIPDKLSFNGGALIGCSAGFLNAVKIKGTHTAMKSGMVAAETIFDALVAEEGDAAASTPAVADTGELSPDYIPQKVDAYDAKLKKSWVYDELYQVRNVHQAFSKWGIGIGMLYTGLATHITKGREPWTLHPPSPSDSESTLQVDDDKSTTTATTLSKYPPADGKVTFDLLTNLQRSNTYHEEDQPSHLRIKTGYETIPQTISLQQYDGPEQRFCPAAVYEYVDDDNGNDNNNDKKKKLVINAQNCVHCKCCSIKMPHEYIQWTVPEGGGGPQYQVM
mmetsp:Transcript_14404/g.40944  ORF Transcript_14404/g.40944 Transcript_14404/m.40944 type:complete len:751 (+) Transcript_14404:69-2321(+)|eukprot:CAMPEP_0119546640 /NCGR_PEP_ID=MMETSP1352-20130426/971_1 /TAXON_ID=265584 /ORGANISM="Stauroneis constricta, Strain CCMP1120" /LENGTH=750 /DNA_ID=CAMNT_0007591361 /DNA_START=45 /DNA_END=2297 /DNA_ORIENTATION=+